MSASNIPNKDGKYDRKCKGPDGKPLPDNRCLPASMIPQDIPVFYRATAEDTLRLDAMRRELGFSGRAGLVSHGLDVVARLHARLAPLGARDRIALLDEALDVMTQLEDLAATLNYRDRADLLSDLIAGLLFLLKKGPLPPFLRVEETPGLKLPANADMPTLI